MAQAYIPGIAVEAAVVSASGTITLKRPAIRVDEILFLNGGATAVSAQTATITTATSTVTNAFTFTGTAESPSKTITANSGLGTATLAIVTYLPAGSVESDQ